MPSASVLTGPSGGASPRYGAHTAACTPTTRTSGRSDFTATATPAARPPPPSGTITHARSSMSSTSSSPSVPCPFTTTGSSKGWQKTSPAALAYACDAAIASVRLAPPSWTIAPAARQASIFEIGAPAGTNSSHRTPWWRAASAIPCAWLPALPAVTPLRAASPSATSLFIPPRILNAPVRCRFSAFNTTGAPAVSDSAADGSTGVWTTSGRPAWCAARMAFRSTVTRPTVPRCSCRGRPMPQRPEREHGEQHRAAHCAAEQRPAAAGVGEHDGRRGGPIVCPRRAQPVHTASTAPRCSSGDSCRADSCNVGIIAPSPKP